jgi:hypothetical protein
LSKKKNSFHAKNVKMKKKIPIISLNKGEKKTSSPSKNCGGPKKRINPYKSSSTPSYPTLSYI